MHVKTDRSTGPLTRQSAQAEYDKLALDSLQSLQGAAGPCELFWRFQQACADLGASNALYVHAIPEPQGRWEYKLLLACDDTLANAIRNCGDVQQHRWLRYAATHSDPILASELADAPIRTATGSIHLQEHGFRSALLLPTHGPGSTERFGLLCLGADPNAKLPAPDLNRLRVLGAALASELHTWWMQRTRQDLRAQARLRSDDLKLLRLELDGLSTKAIARELDTSCSSIDSRFQRLNLKLACSNRRASALRAAVHGLI